MSGPRNAKCETGSKQCEMVEWGSRCSELRAPVLGRQTDREKSLLFPALRVRFDSLFARFGTGFEANNAPPSPEVILKGTRR